MLNNEAIRYLYRHAKRPAGGFTDEFLARVCNLCQNFHCLKFEGSFMTITSLETTNPFRKIYMPSIKGIEILDTDVAIVTHTCIIFFDNHTGEISVNIRKTNNERLISVQMYMQRLLKVLCHCFHKRQCKC